MKWLKKLLVIILIIIVLYFCFCGAAAYFQVATMGEGLFAFGFSSTGMNFVVAGLALAGAYMISPSTASEMVGRITDGLSDFTGKLVSGAGNVVKSGVNAIFDIIAPYIPLCIGGYVVYKIFSSDDGHKTVDHRYNRIVYHESRNDAIINRAEPRDRELDISTDGTTTGSNLVTNNEGLSVSTEYLAYDDDSSSKLHNKELIE